MILRRACVCVSLTVAPAVRAVIDGAARYCFCAVDATVACPQPFVANVVLITATSTLLIDSLCSCLCCPTPPALRVGGVSLEPGGFFAYVHSHAHNPDVLEKAAYDKIVEGTCYPPDGKREIVIASAARL